MADIEKETQPSPPESSEGFEQLLAHLEAGNPLSAQQEQRLLRALEKSKQPRVQAVSKDIEHQAMNAMETVDHAKIWPWFQTKVAREEIEKLTPQDIKSIDELTKELAPAVGAFRVTTAKPIGATYLTREDYTGFDLMPASVDFVSLGQEIQKKLTPALLNIARQEWNHNAMNVFQHPSDAGSVVVQCKFFTPADTSAVDDRAIINNYSLVVKKGEWLKILESPNGLRLVPFVLRNIAVSKCADPKLEVFFDGSLAGKNAPYGKDKNPIVALLFDERKMVLANDTSSAQAPQTTSAPNDEQFAQNATQHLKKRPMSNNKFDLFGLKDHPTRASYKRNVR